MKLVGDLPPLEALTRIHDSSSTLVRVICSRLFMKQVHFAREIASTNSIRGTSLSHES